MNIHRSTKNQLAERSAWSVGRWTLNVKRLGRPFAWVWWLVLITAPFLWVQVGYDMPSRRMVASFRSSRWAFFTDHLPQLLAAVALVATLSALVWAYRQHHGRQTGSLRWRFPNSILLRAGLLVLILLIPTLTFPDKYLDMAFFTGLYIVLALGLNITVGFTGLLVLGYAAFFAIGAYTFAILQRDLGVPFWLATLPAAGVAALFGFLLGLPSLRLRGDYLAIVTLGFGEAVRYGLKNLSGLTGGDFGIIIQREAKIPTLAGLSRVQVAYLIVALLVWATVFVIYRLNHSRLGRAWIAIREDEVAAASVGIPTVRLKILAFTLSAIWAGLAGVVYAGYTGFVDPETFRFEESALILSMVVLGGMGSVPGAMLGAVALYIGPRLLRDQFPAVVDYRLMIFGATMVLMMIFRPQGLVGSVRRRTELAPPEQA